MCKNCDGENLVKFWWLSISPNLSGTKVSLYMVLCKLNYCKSIAMAMNTKHCHVNRD